MKQRIAIEGMSCAHCVAHVEQAVNELPGIQKITVSLKKKSGVVKFDNSQVTSEEIVNKINQATHYQATVK